MPLIESLPLTPATAQWPVWSTTARLVVTDPSYVAQAQAIAQDLLNAVDTACSRFRPDSELMTLPSGRPVQISPMLATLVREALAAAEITGGMVSPTIGNALSALGYDRDWSVMAGGVTTRAASSVRVRAAPSWRQIQLDGDVLTVPEGVTLDLGATGKALTADLIAAEIVARLPIGALMALGGDIATAGPLPDGGWNVLVQDLPGDPAVTVLLPPGGAIATSSTQSRRWQQGGESMHHILDPRNCRPAERVWRTATVAADRCVTANTLSTAALILGRSAPAWLRDQGAASRLVSAGEAAEVLCINGFPEEGQL